MHDPNPIAFSARAKRYPQFAQALAQVGFPVLMTLCLGGFLGSVAAGHDPRKAMVVGIAMGYFTIALLERIFPYRDSWLHSSGDLTADSAWFVTNSGLNRLLEPPVLAAATTAGAWLALRSGMNVWPTEWPLLGQLAFALVVAEFFEYWFHRLMHENAFLWRFHATHHSAPRLYWFNAIRFHAIDYIAVGIVKLIPLALLGAPLEVFAGVNLFAAVHGAYQHANVPVRIGPLNWIFSMTELHRWHHARPAAEANHNYGGNLALWDIVFGTRFLPTDRPPPEDIGLEGLEAFPTGYWQQLLSPFRWSKIR